MLETLPKSDVDTTPRICSCDGIRYAYHDYAQFVVISYPDGYLTARAMTETEIRQAQQIETIRNMPADDVEDLPFVVDLARHMQRPRFWWDCLVMFALLAAVIAVGAILQLGHKAHLINH